MKTPVVTLFVAIFFCASIGVRADDPTEEQVTQPINTILDLKLPKTVQDVIWSIQEKNCTIQINFPSVRDHLPPEKPEHSEHPKTKVWLLKADGTVILPRNQYPSYLGISMAMWVTYSDSYSFPATAKTQAVAIVMSIDGDFFVAKL